MVRSEQEVLFKGDAAHFFQEVNKVIQKTKEHEAALKKIGAESKKLSKAEKDRARETKRAFDEIRGPQQRYEGRMRALNELVKKGSITQREYARAARQAQDRLQGVGRAGQQAFGARALERLKSMVAGYVGVAAAVQGVTKALRDQQQLREEIAQKQREVRDPFGKLQQVATSARDYRHLIAKSKEFYAAGAAPDQGRAAETVFQLRSAGQLKEQFGLFKQMGRSRLFPDPGGISAAAAALTTSLGEKETGNLRQVVSKALAASAGAPAAAEQILVATAPSGGVAKTLGLSDEELLAAVTVSAKAAKGAELGGTRIKRMLISMEEAGLKKGTLLERLQQIEASGGVGVGAPYRKAFGRELGRQAYSDIMGNLPLYRKALGDIQEANRRDLVSEKAGFYKTDPGTFAATMADTAAAEKELGGERLGIAANRVNAVRDRIQAQLLEKGQETASQFFGYGEYLLRSLLGDELLIKAFQRRTKNQFREVTGREFRGTESGIGGNEEVVSELKEMNSKLDNIGRQRPVQQRN